MINSLSFSNPLNEDSSIYSGPESNSVNIFKELVSSNLLKKNDLISFPSFWVIKLPIYESTYYVYVTNILIAAYLWDIFWISPGYLLLKINIISEAFLRLSYNSIIIGYNVSYSSFLSYNYAIVELKTNINNWITLKFSSKVNNVKN